MKKILFTILMSCLAFWGFAENRLYMDEQVSFTAVGERKTINVYLDQDEVSDISGMQMKITLPNWLAIVNDEDGYMRFVDSGTRFVDHAIDTEVSVTNKTVVSLVLYSPTASPLNKPESKLLFSFLVDVAEIPAVDDIHDIVISNVKASMQDNALDARNVPVTLGTMCRMTYLPSEYTISMEEHETNVIVGGQKSIRAIVDPAEVAPSLNWEVVTGSDNLSISYENDVCNLRGLALGTATVRVYAGTNTSVYDECVVTISSTPTAVQINQHSVYMKVGEKVQLSASVTPGEASQKVRWSVVDDSPVVTIDENGLVVAKQAGSATVMVETVDGSYLSDFCSIVADLPTCDYIVIDETTFPDDELRDIVEHLPEVVVVDGEARLYEDYADDVTSLDLSGTGVTDFTGLENFPNLDFVDVSGNNLTPDQVDNLIDHLPENGDGGTIHIIGENDETTLTPEQIQDLIDKGWTPEQYDSETGEWVPIEGEEYIPIDEAHFPDANFRTFLIAQPYGTDARLFRSEIAEIKEMSPTSKNITDLTGIAYFTELHKLRVSGNKLETLDVSTLDLDTIQAGINLLTQVILPTAGNLKYADLGNNLLSEIDLSNCQNLRILNLQFNKFSTVDLSGCTNVNYVNVTDNYFTTLDFSNNGFVTNIFMSHNQVKDAGLDDLIETLPTRVNGKYPLYIIKEEPNVVHDETFNEGNVVTKAQVAAARAKGWYPKYWDSVERVWKDYEGIIPIDGSVFPDENLQDALTEMDFGQDGVITNEEAEGVTSLDLSDQGITDPTGLDNFPNLNDLDITGNDITGDNMDKLIDELPDHSGDEGGTIHVDADDITDEQIADLNDKGWTVVDENGNELTPDFIPIDEEHFPDANFRTFLIAQPYGTDARLFRSEIAEIKTMNANSKNIADVTGIAYFTELYKLTLQNNKLTSIDVSTLDLDTLNLYYNSLEHVVLPISGSLKYLDLSYNHLSEVDLSNCGNLKILSMSKNRLSTIDLSGCPNVYYLSISGNYFTSVDISDNAILRQFYIAQNQVKGAALDEIIESLPSMPGSRLGLYIINETTDTYHSITYTEGNAITKSQVAAARAKGWYPKYWDVTDNTWKDFDGVEDPENRLYIEDFTILPGETKTITVNLDNETDFRAIDARMILPEGLTIETKSNGKPAISLVDARDDEHTKSFSFDNDTIVISVHHDENVFLGNSGAFLTFKLTAASDFEGPQVLRIEKIIGTGADDVRYSLPVNETTVSSVAQFATGDVNEDGYVNVGDVTELYKVITGVDMSYARNADVNGDGVINTGDVSALYQLILQQ